MIETLITKITRLLDRSFTPYEAQAIKNAEQVLIDDYPVKFASCEDVVIHKMVAGRAIDEEDIISILAKNRDAIDFEYIDKWLSEFGMIPEHEDEIAADLAAVSRALGQQINPAHEGMRMYL